jgi:hypothetical protein
MEEIAALAAFLTTLELEVLMNEQTQLCIFHHCHQLCPLLQKLSEEKHLMPIHVGSDLKKWKSYEIY